MARRKTSAAGRRPHRSGVRTRLSILRAAEQVFAERGFEAASLREITSLAGVDLALVNYHFGSKDRLYIAILSRRNGSINKRRLLQLQRARATFSPEPIPLPVIVDCFLDPIVDRLITRAPGWRTWGKIAAQITSSPQVLQHQREEMDSVSLVFIEELRRSLPHVRHGSLYFRYVFMVSVLLEMLHGTERVHNLSGGGEDMRNIAVAREEARTFILAALGAP